jgi:hypothetical protein
VGLAVQMGPSQAEAGVARPRCTQVAGGATGVALQVGAQVDERMWTAATAFCGSEEQTKQLRERATWSVDWQPAAQHAVQGLPFLAPHPPGPPHMITYTPTPFNLPPNTTNSNHSHHSAHLRSDVKPLGATSHLLKDPEHLGAHDCRGVGAGAGRGQEGAGCAFSCAAWQLQREWVRAKDDHCVIKGRGEAVPCA